ncbi:hypothetical protein KC207_13965 [Phycicoccus sp. BSK3Z-2]|uniref:Putative T7SS secretion signal domain-containing protein n=1 Tax=Phycicoccus avicenniae TaxID=2828860 RepID=A0A941I1K3_9MICO|nr:hypothetical protein [Phycicoccus avicenniae]MBR7744396.1 hypothetical protein [Phycicoccus avicenniae]
MTRVLEPVPGSGEGLRRLADALGATGQRLADTASDLVRLRDAAVWDGPAGEAFGERVGPVPTVLDRAARRFRGAVGPLHTYAEELEIEQRVVQRAVDRHAEASEEYRLLEDRAWALVSSGVDETDPSLRQVRALQQDRAGVMLEAEREHAGGWERLREADARCAATLRALADDDLADGLGYRGLHAVSSTGHATATAAVMLARKGGGTAAAVGLGAEGLALGADGVLLLGYGEGDWGEVATGAGLAVAGGVGRAATQGARLGAYVRADGTAARVAHISTGDRVALGLSMEAHARVDRARAALRLQAPPRPARPGGTAEAPAGTRPAAAPAGTVVGKGLAAARARVDDTVRRGRQDWALASVGGVPTQRLYAAGMTLRAGSWTAGKVPDAPAPRPVPFAAPAPGRPTTGGGEATR